MFRFTERLSRAGAPDSRRYLKRAGLFAAGLVLLWTAIQLFPTTPPPEPAVYSDDSGSVASRERVHTPYEGPRLFTLGNLAAFLLLAGGGAFAVYLHRRSAPGARGTAHIETIGELPIGQGQQLRLVRCGGEILLIGATAHEITLLRDFDPDLFDHPTIAPADDARDERGSTRHEVARSSTPSESERGSSQPNGGAAPHRPHPSSTHFADVLRQYAGRYVNIQSNGRPC